NLRRRRNARRSGLLREALARSSSCGGGSGANDGDGEEDGGAVESCAIQAPPRAATAEEALPALLRRRAPSAEGTDLGRLAGEHAATHPHRRGYADASTFSHQDCYRRLRHLTGSASSSDEARGLGALVIAPYRRSGI